MNFQSEFSGYTIFTFHFNEEHVLFMQWEIFCDACGSNQIDAQLLQHLLDSVEVQYLYTLTYENDKCLL